MAERTNIHDQQFAVQSLIEIYVITGTMYVENDLSRLEGREGGSTTKFNTSTPRPMVSLHILLMLHSRSGSSKREAVFILYLVFASNPLH